MHWSESEYDARGRQHTYQEGILQGREMVRRREVRDNGGPERRWGPLLSALSQLKSPPGLRIL
jgi:hypothetical protein